MVEHPKLEAAAIEALQRHCFREDFRRLGPSVYRSIATWLRGYRTLGRSTNPMLRRKSERFARDLRKAYPVFLAGRLFGPGRAGRARIAGLQREVHAAIGRPRASERALALVAAAMALWTSITLRFGLFQDPRLTKHAWRLPAEARRPARIWRKLVAARDDVTVERRPDGAVWLRVDGALGAEGSARIARQTREALRRTRDRLVLDLKGLTQFDGDAAQHLADGLREHRARIRILAPASLSHPGVAAALAIFSVYHGPGTGL